MLWLNGTLYEGTVAPFDLTDRGLLLADGIFDTALVLNQSIFRGAEHLERLYKGAAELGIEADREAVTTALAALLPYGNCASLRLTLTRGPGPRGLRPQNPQTPTVLASLAPLANPSFFTPLSLDISSIRRNETSPASRLKTLAYLDAVLASRDAALHGFDETLFLNTKGHVACAAAGNIFALKGIKLLTPPVEDGVLAGIIRAFVITESRALGLTACEQSIDLDALLTADAVFLTNSLRLIAPVERIAQNAIATRGWSTLEALKSRLAEALKKECGLPENWPIAGAKP
jgi:branched-chain amino acid aminotransferase